MNYPAPKTFVSPGLRKLLLRLNICQEAQLQELSQVVSDSQIIRALAERFQIDETGIAEQIAADLGLPMVTIDEPPIDVVSLLDKDFALQYRCFPIREDGDHLIVALADPLDLEAISQIEFVLQKEVEVHLALESNILRAIERFLSDEGSFDNLEDVSGAVEIITDSPGDKEQEQEGSKAAPIVRLVNKILTDASNLGASDIHLEPTANQLDVRFRVDGVMATRLTIPKRLQQYVITRVKILAGMDITERRRPQDGGFRIRTGKYRTRDVRASAVPTLYGENLVLRLLRSDFEGLSFESLGLDIELTQKLQKMLRKPDRIILVTGPTGSGKSTTLYAALQHLRQGTNNIITVEDPIEFRVPGITQIQVDTKVGITFAGGLRSILRQDPDVILVGEIRDLETAEIAFQAAQTGHLVLSTLHTNDAISAVVRLRDLGLEPFVIAASLGGIIAQRLVRKLCGECKKPVDQATQRALEEKYGQRFERLLQANGCQACAHGGFSDRIGVYSLLPISSSLREAIRDEASDERLHEIAQELGMQELFEAGLDLVSRGVTSLQELERVISEENFQLRQEESGTERSVAELAAAYHSTQDKPKRVLLVDDDDGVRIVMGMSMEKAGFEVEAFSSGQEALEALQSFQPDIAVLDLMMPGMDGREVLGKLRERVPKLPVLMLTAADDEQSEMSLLDAGASDYVSKASSPALVIARMKRLLQ